MEINIYTNTGITKKVPKESLIDLVKNRNTVNTIIKFMRNTLHSLGNKSSHLLIFS